MGLAYGIKFNMKIAGDLDRAQAEADKKFYQTKHEEHAGIAYRVEAVRYAGHNPYATPHGGEDYITDPCLELFTFNITHNTPKGFMLENQGTVSSNRRWVPDDKYAKQWASRTPEQALDQFRTRRQLQIRILKKQLARAEKELSLTEPKKELT